VESAVMITVWAGSVPPPLETLRLPELAHLDVFVSRTSEEGRQRYRVHVGYFPDISAAKRVLPQLRKIYPSAWIVPADRHRRLGRIKPPEALEMPRLEPVALPAAGATRAASVMEDVLEIPEIHDSSDLLPRLGVSDEVSSDPPVPALKPVSIQSVRKPAAPMFAAAKPEFREVGGDLVRLIVEEWQVKAHLAPGAPVSRSWLKRLPGLIRGARAYR
jgi:SPOR domain